MPIDFATTVIQYFIFEETVKVFCNFGPRQYDLCLYHIFV